MTLAATNLPTGASFDPAAGRFDWTPAYTQAGTYTVTFTATSGITSLTDSKPVGITVQDVNRAPTAANDSATTSEDTTIDIAVLTNDVDPDGDVVTVASVTQASHGTVTINGNGTVRYVPALNYYGNDTFTYTAKDASNAQSNIAIVSITVTAVNDPPVANAQSVTANEDTAKGIVLNATDVDGDTLAYTEVAAPAHGTLTGTPPNLTYTPGPNYNGQDSFTFKANDGHVDSNIATVSINIVPVNDAPVANAQSVTANEDTAKGIVLNATDVDGDTLAYTVVAAPAHGTLSGSPPNLSYTPLLNYNGPDSFTFKANDGHVDSNIATVSITVIAVDDPPAVTVPDARTVAPGSTLTFTVTGTDPDGTKITLSATNLPSGATFKPSTGVFSWRPTAAQTRVQPYVVSFTATSGTPPLTDTKTVSIRVGYTSSTALSSSSNPSRSGDSVTFTARVTSSGAAVPTGNVTFKDGLVSIGTGVLNGSGLATFTTISLGVGSHSLIASYAGDSATLPSDSAALAQVVNPSGGTSSTTTLTSSLNPSATGQAVTFTATVSSDDAAIPTGTVTFKDGGTAMATVALNSSGQAALTTTSLTEGTHSITATYGGSATILGSTSAALSQVVRYATTTTLTSVPNPSVVGNNVAFTATVTSGGGTPQGNVAFYDGSTLLGTIGLTNGTVVFSTDVLPAGTHTITAQFSDSGVFAASSATVKQRVARK